MDGRIATIWTIRFAALLYLLFVFINLVGRHKSTARVLWTAALGFYLAHVVTAFDSHYRWSHAIAYAETAKQTAAVFGVHWGGGIFVNYAFTLIWSADCVWWWLNSRSYRERPESLSTAVHALAAFMFLNGAVVFGRGPTQLVGAVTTAVLSVMWIVRRTAVRSRAAPPRRKDAKPSGGS